MTDMFSVYRRTLGFFVFGLVVLTTFSWNSSTFAASQISVIQTHDISQSDNFNLRIDGASASDSIGDIILTGDLDNNGTQDIVIGTTETDYHSRSRAGSVYVIYDEVFSGFSGTGNTLDLSDPNNFNIRFDAEHSVSLLTAYFSATIGDLDNDGLDDLIFGSGHVDSTSYNSGSLYVIFNTLLQQYTGRGNIVDLADTSTGTPYNIRYDGRPNGGQLSTAIDVADINSNGRNDLVVGARADGIANNLSGCVYLVYDDIIDDYYGTYNNQIPIYNSSNHNIVFEGPAFNTRLSNGSVIADDFNQDGNQDLAMGAYSADYGGNNTGSVYVVDNSIVSSLTGTGNYIDLALGTSYSLRFDGPGIDSNLGIFSLTSGDVDSNGYPDLIFGTAFDVADNGRGYTYLVYDSIIQSASGTGNVFGMSDPSNYNVRFHGIYNIERFGFLLPEPVDFNNDNEIDLVFHGSNADHNGNNSGSVYMIYNGILSALSGTGNYLPMSDDSNYSLRFDGGAGMSVGRPTIFRDLNSDSNVDLLVTAPSADYNGRDNSGSVYILYNFPHSITAGFEDYQYRNENTLLGSVQAPDSVTSIAGVQFQVDSASVSGTWIDCVAVDGSFDSIDEEYECEVPELSGSQPHTIYVRAVDINDVYTHSSRYAIAEIPPESLPETGINIVSLFILGLFCFFFPHK